MPQLTVIATGKLKEQYYRQAVQEYAKRLGAHAQLTLIELPEQRLPDNPSPAQIHSALEKEAEAVRARLPKGAYLVLLTPEGRLLSSVDLADRMAALQAGGRSSIVFVLGSSYGLSDSLKSQADLLLSMSKMTFPHHLARVMLLEQLYRSQSILSGSRYHK